MTYFLQLVKPQPFPQDYDNQKEFQIRHHLMDKCNPLFVNSTFADSARKRVMLVCNLIRQQVNENILS